MLFKVERVEGGIANPYFIGTHFNAPIIGGTNELPLTLMKWIKRRIIIGRRISKR